MTQSLLSVQQKKILITGGSGFIGSHLAEHLSANNDVTVFDNGRRNALMFIPDTECRIRSIVGDIRDDQAVNSCLRGQDIVLHLAAIAGASSYGKDPLLTLSVNLSGTMNVLEAASRNSPELVVVFSTSEVYGSKAPNAQETDPTPIGPVSEPRWTYAVSKVAGDHLAMAYFRSRGLPMVSVRPFNVFGPRQVGEGAIVRMVQSALTEKTIPVSGDGRQSRAWCYIDDFLNALSRILVRKPIGECFNIGNPDNFLTMNALASHIRTIIPKATIRHIAGNKTDIRIRKPDISKIERELGFRPTVSIATGLAETIDWLKQHPVPGV